MNNICKCNQCNKYIYNHITFNELTECITCKRFYLFKHEEWKEISQDEFRILYRKRLIEQQQSNKSNKNNSFET